MKVSLPQYVYRNWVKKRHEHNPIELTHNNIYIVPSKLGALFLALTLVLFVVGVNYQNNLLLLSSYFFVVLQLLAFFSSFRNLHKLRFQVTDIESVFAPSTPRMHFRITSIQPNTSLSLGIEQKISEISFTGSHYLGNLVLPFSTRGYYPLPRVSIFSTYPYGLVKAFSYWQPPLNVYVYPALTINSNRNIEPKNTTDDLEYVGTKGFSPGDNQVRISWKHFARTGNLQVKQFDSQATKNAQSVLYLSYLEEHGDKEVRLSALSTKLKEALAARLHVVLILPNRIEVKAFDEQSFCKAWETLSEY